MLVGCDVELVRFAVHGDANFALDGHLRVGAVEQAIAVVEAAIVTPGVAVVRPHAVVVPRGDDVHPLGLRLAGLTLLALRAGVAGVALGAGLALDTLDAPGAGVAGVALGAGLALDTPDAPGAGVTLVALVALVALEELHIRDRCRQLGIRGSNVHVGRQRVDNTGHTVFEVCDTRRKSLGVTGERRDGAAAVAEVAGRDELAVCLAIDIAGARGAREADLRGGDGRGDEADESESLHGTWRESQVA